MATSDRSDYRSAPPISHRGSLVDTRAAERFVPQWREATILDKKDRKLNGRILNISALGVAIEADFSEIHPDDVVIVGRRKVKPGRKIMGGAVFLFDPPLPKRVCGRDLVL